MGWRLQHVKRLPRHHRDTQRHRQCRQPDARTRYCRQSNVSYPTNLSQQCILQTHSHAWFHAEERSQFTFYSASQQLHLEFCLNPHPPPPAHMMTFNCPSTVHRQSLFQSMVATPESLQHSFDIALVAAVRWQPHHRRLQTLQ